MKGFVLVTHTLPAQWPLDAGTSSPVPLRQEMYVSVADIVTIRKIRDHDGLCECTEEECPLVPFYDIVVKNRFIHEILPMSSILRFIVHPNEHEHMERILEGSNNQVADLADMLIKRPRVE